MVDGLKISLRKILFSAFKRKLTSEIKVAQFSGYVSEHSAYHHGEASLNGAIVNMAQNFVGSNNINLLEPNGQFGTRLHGGDDSASERYIFTMLNSLTRSLFPDADDSVLSYQNDDGTIVEPDYYVPIIPFALINGISGIGTGFSCSIAPYNPSTIIDYLKDKLNKKDVSTIEFLPYYEGFKGSVSKIADQKYLIKGVYEKIADDKVRITELPVGTWTMPYTSFLESLVDGVTDKNGKKSSPLLRDFTSISTEVTVDFTVVFPRGKLAQLEGEIDANNCNGVEKLLKLSTTVSTTNMHMFNSECKLHKYASPEEIIDDFYGVRIGIYHKRKEYLIAEMEKKLVRLSNRAKYIQETLAGTVDLRRKKSDQVTELLTKKQYATIDGDFKYLIKMPMDSVTEENVTSIMKEKETTETELDTLKKTTVEKMWLGELNTLEKEYAKYKTKREKIQIGEGTKSKSKSQSATKKKVVVRKKK
jgi:DNA topoisomerase-2